MPAPLAPWTVVLVDDDEALREALAFSLETQGFAVKACENGEALLGLDLPAERAWLLIDNRLGGISGIDALEALRSRGVTLPAIVITSSPPPALCERALRSGALVIEKPLLDGELFEALRGAF